MIKSRLDDGDQSHEDEVVEMDMQSVKHQQFSRMQNAKNQKIKHQTCQQDATNSNVNQVNDHEN